MASETIKEFLVSLGWTNDEAQFKRFEGAIALATADIIKLGTALTTAAATSLLMTNRIAAGFEALGTMAEQAGAKANDIQNLGTAFSSLGLSADLAKKTIVDLGMLLRSTPSYNGILQTLGAKPEHFGKAYESLMDIFRDPKFKAMDEGQAERRLAAAGISKEFTFAMRSHIEEVDKVIAAEDEKNKKMHINTDQSIKDAAEFTKVWTSAWSTVEKELGQAGDVFMKAWVGPIKDFDSWLSNNKGSLADWLSWVMVAPGAKHSVLSSRLGLNVKSDHLRSLHPNEEHRRIFGYRNYHHPLEGLFSGQDPNRRPLAPTEPGSATETTQQGVLAAIKSGFDRLVAYLGLGPGGGGGGGGGSFSEYEGSASGGHGATRRGRFGHGGVGSAGEGGGSRAFSGGNIGGAAPGNTADAMRIAKDQLRKEGVSPEHLDAAAAMLVGNAIHESGLKPTAVHDLVNGHPTGYGIYGARLGRRDRMFGWLKEHGYAMNSLEGQMRYMAHEAMTSPTYGPTRRALESATSGSLSQGTVTVERNFESPVPGSSASRVSGAMKAYALRNAAKEKAIEPQSKPSGASAESRTELTPSSTAPQLTHDTKSLHDFATEIIKKTHHHKEHQASLTSHIPLGHHMVHEALSSATNNHTFNSSPHFTINAASDPHTTAKLITAMQTQVNADLIRQFRSAAT